MNNLLYNKIINNIEPLENEIRFNCASSKETDIVEEDIIDINKSLLKLYKSLYAVLNIKFIIKETPRDGEEPMRDIILQFPTNPSLYITENQFRRLIIDSFIFPSIRQQLFDLCNTGNADIANNFKCYMISKAY